MLKIEPQGNRIIVEPLETLETKSSGGVLLDIQSVPTGKEGKIVFIGPACSQAMDWSHAVYAETSGYDMYIEGILYRVLAEYEVIYFKNISDAKALKSEDRVFSEDSPMRNG